MTSKTSMTEDTSAIQEAAPEVEGVVFGLPDGADLRLVSVSGALPPFAYRVIEAVRA